MILRFIISMFSVKIGLLFVLQSRYVRRIDLDGSNSITLYSGGYPIAMDYDYRFGIQLINKCV